MVDVPWRVLLALPDRVSAGRTDPVVDAVDAVLPADPTGACGLGAGHLWKDAAANSARGDVEEVISAWTGIPVGKMLKDEIATVLALDAIQSEGWAEMRGERWYVRSTQPLRAGQAARVLTREGLTLCVEPQDP